MLWITTTAAAPTKPRIDRMFETVVAPPLSSSSSAVRMVAAWVSEGPEVPSGWVGGWSCTVALGRETVWPPGAPSGAVLSATVGAPGPGAVLRRIVGAGAGALGAPAGRRAIVGAGAGAVGRGAPPTVGAATLGAGGADMPLGIGGFGAGGAPGAAGGASDALRVTRTVSFLSGMVEVCLEAGIDEVARGAGIDEVDRGGGISFSLIARRFWIARLGKATSPPPTCQTSISRPGKRAGFFRVSGRNRRISPGCLTRRRSGIDWGP